jgi:hypothetical protein
MTEREDTIERIETVLKLTNKKSITVTIPRLTAERAVSMLKEREPVKPEWYRGLPSCGDCGCKIVSSGDKFCRHCGRPVMWDG